MARVRWITYCSKPIEFKARFVAWKRANLQGDQRLATDQTASEADCDAENGRPGDQLPDGNVQRCGEREGHRPNRSDRRDEISKYHCMCVLPFRESYSLYAYSLCIR